MTNESFEKVIEWIRDLQEHTSLQTMGERLAMLIPCRVVGLFRVNLERGTMQSLGVKGFRGFTYPDLEYPLACPDSLVAHCHARRTRVDFIRSRNNDLLNLGENSSKIIGSLDIDRATAFPLIYAGDVVGSIYVADNDRGGCSTNTLSNVEMIAPVIAAMIVRQGLLQRLSLENSVLRRTYELADRWMSEHEGEDVLWGHFRQLLETIGGVQGGTYSRKVHGQWIVQEVFGDTLLEHVEALKRDVPLWLAARTPHREGTASAMIWTPLGVSVLPSYIEERPNSLRGLAYWVGDERSGAAITVYWNSSTDEGEVLIPNILQAFGMTFRVMQQQRQLVDQGEKDDLTGALNRRGLERRLESFLCTQENRRAVMVMIDLDGFKLFNDQHGHQAGDEALKEMVEYGRAQLPASAWLARIGGDEFIVVYTNRTWDDTLVHEWRVVLRDSPLRKYGLHMTVGGVELPTECVNFGQAYRLADERLYIGKRGSKGCLVGPESRLWELSVP